MKKRIFGVRMLICVLGAALFALCALLPTRSVRGAAEETVAEEDRTLAATYAPETRLVNAPTVVADVTSAERLAALTDPEGRSPASAVFRLDAQANVVDAQGASLGSFYEIYKSLDHKIIPIVRLDGAAEADAFISFMKSRLFILDLAVLSEDASLVKRVRGEFPEIRGIVEYRDADELYPIVRESTEAGAMTVILPQKCADAVTVNYLQARFKTVWVRAESAAFGDVADALFGGAYGVVAEDFSAVYDFMEDTEAVYTRNIFNVGHRALPKKYNENGLTGLRAAMENGVTHVELDGHLTKDKRIVVIHDDTITAATNGTGTISSMTYEQLMKYDLDLHEPHEKIPTLEEVIDVISGYNAEKGADVVFVFEIKDDQKDFVQYMKAILDEKNFYEHIVIITFDGTEHQLSALREQVPWIPVANLDGIGETQFASRLGGQNALNAGFDLSNSNCTASYGKKLKDRGFVGWYWTYDAAANVFAAAKQGVLGVTNNEADCFRDEIRYIFGADAQKASSDVVPREGGTLMVTLVRYSGENADAAGEVYKVEETERFWRIHVRYTEDERTFYARPVYYYKPAAGGDLWWILTLAIAGAAIVVAGVSAAVILKKKRGGKSHPSH